MGDILDIFGANAGKVWHFLKGKGHSSVREIADGTELKLNEVHNALGWLSREGKICINNETKTLRYGLME